MSAAIAGLIGVAAGALITGGVQAIGAVWSRRLESRTAARLLYVNLIDVWTQIGYALRTKSWFGVTGLPKMQASWKDSQTALARVLSTKDFSDLSISFVIFEKFAQSQQRRIDSDSFEFKDESGGIQAEEQSAKDRINRIEHMASIVWRASLPWWQKGRTKDVNAADAVNAFADDIGGS